MHLPNSDEASISLNKITDYLLNRSHEEGGSKALFFESFGFNKGNVSVFAEALLDLAQRKEVSRIVENPFGTKYIIEGKLISPDGRNPEITTVWIIENNSKIAKLVTAYPK